MNRNRQTVPVLTDRDLDRVRVRASLLVLARPDTCYRKNGRVKYRNVTRSQESYEGRAGARPSSASGCEVCLSRNSESAIQNKGILAIESPVVATRDRDGQPVVDGQFAKRDWHTCRQVNYIGSVAEVSNAERGP